MTNNDYNKILGMLFLIKAATHFEYSRMNNEMAVRKVNNVISSIRPGSYTASYGHHVSAVNNLEEYGKLRFGVDVWLQLTRAIYYFRIFIGEREADNYWFANVVEIRPFADYAGNPGYFEEIV